MTSQHWRTLPIKNAQLPQNVARPESYCMLWLSEYPNAPQRRNPTDPTKFQNPTDVRSVTKYAAPLTLPAEVQGTGEPPVVLDFNHEDQAREGEAHTTDN
jgi:hypothetical protein